MMNTDEKKIDRILVGVDFSEASRCAVQEALNLARQQQSEVHVVHIIEESMTEAIEKYSKLSRGEMRASVMERLESFCQELNKHKDRIHCEVIIGHTVKDFGNACDRFDPDLVVLGAWGSQRHDDRSAGVTVKQIVQECKSDVLLMRPKPPHRFVNVVACIDFSDYDIPIIRAADQLCLAEEGSLDIVHVFYPPWKSEQITDVDSVVITPDFEAEYKAVLRGRLDALVPLNIHGVPTIETQTTVLEHAKHCDGILNYLKTADADIVIVGARGQSKIESMILGRIAERIVTESPCSVYIVKSIGDA